MKRFDWPLERLLKVTAQRERALQAELVRRSRDLASVHQEIFRRQAELRGVLTDLAAESPSRRLPAQAVVMGCAEAAEARLDRLRSRLAELVARRRQTLADFERARSSRKTLERLRAEALRRHARTVQRLEQKALDDAAQSTFVRRRLQAPPTADR
jgi:hypothetical protein